MKLGFLDKFSKYNQVSLFMKIILVGVELLHAYERKEGWTDRQGETNIYF